MKNNIWGIISIVLGIICIGLGLADPKTLFHIAGAILFGSGVIAFSIAKNKTNL